MSLAKLLSTSSLLNMIVDSMIKNIGTKIIIAEKTERPIIKSFLIILNFARLFSFSSLEFVTYFKRMISSSALLACEAPMI